MLDKVKSRRLWAVVWTLIAMVVGLVLRYGPYHFPHFLAKYGGSAVWTGMIYTLFVIAFPHRRPLDICIMASALSIIIEYIKLFNTPSFYAFRFTMAGQLIFGRHFAYSDIIAYLVGALAFFAIDAYMQSRPGRGRIVQTQPEAL